MTPPSTASCGNGRHLGARQEGAMAPRIRDGSFDRARKKGGGDGNRGPGGLDNRSPRLRDAGRDAKRRGARRTTDRRCGRFTGLHRSPEGAASRSSHRHDVKPLACRAVGDRSGDPPGLWVLLPDPVVRPGPAAFWVVDSRGGCAEGARNPMGGRLEAARSRGSGCRRSGAGYRSLREGERPREETNRR